MSALTGREWANAQRHWLLTLRFAGREWRWSSRAVVVFDADGDGIRFDGGLADPQISLELSGVGRSQESGSISLDLYWPESFAELVGYGHDPAAMTGELSLWAEGETYEHRMVLISGRVEDPIYGDDDEPVSLTLRPQEPQEGPLWPEPSLRVTEETWPNADDSALGRYYPQVFGAPGQYQQNPSRTTSGTPAYVLARDAVTDEAISVLIAGHEVQADSVLIFDDDGASEAFTVTHIADGLGHTVATCTVSAAATIDLNSANFRAGWKTLGTGSPANGGGRLTRDRTGSMERAGDIIEFMLERAPQGVDLGRWARLRSTLNRYVLAGYIDEPVRAWEWLEDNLLSWLPIQVMRGPAGRFPVLIDVDRVPERARFHLREDENCVRISRPEYQMPGGICNEVRINYARRQKTGEWKGQVTVSGVESDASDVVLDHRARVSVSRFQYGDDDNGVRAQELDLRMVYDRGTALRIGHDYVRERSIAHRFIRVKVDADLMRLLPGTEILYTDDRLYIDALPGLVWSWTPENESDVVLEIRLDEVLPRDSRA